MAVCGLRRAAAAVFFGALAAAGPGEGLAAQPCALELVLALDVSASLSEYEYDLQRRGLAGAFRDETVQRAIEALAGPMMVVVTQWASPQEQEVAVGWRRVGGAPEALALAAEIERLENPYPRGGTAIGDALAHVRGLLAASAWGCRRRVVDVSGDGSANMGRDTGVEADALAAMGVTINGLLVLVDRHHGEDPVDFYLQQVLRGPGAFLETAPTFNQYPETIVRKLRREILPELAMGK